MESGICFSTSILNRNKAHRGCLQQKKVFLINHMLLYSKGLSNLCKNHFLSISKYFEDGGLQICLCHHCQLYTQCLKPLNSRYRRIWSYRCNTGESLMPELSQKCPHLSFLKVLLTCSLHVLVESATKFLTWILFIF